MHTAHKLHKCDPADPDRCQATGEGGEGQCRYLSSKGLVACNMLEVSDPSLYDKATNCPKHGGGSSVQKEQRRRLNNYRLEIWQERVNEFCENEKVKTLKDEIGILRLLLETQLNHCRDSMDLILYSHKIGDLVMKIEKVVRSCDRLESNMGMLMDRAGALILAANIVEIISQHIKEPEIIDQISGGIIDAIKGITPHE